MENQYTVKQLIDDVADGADRNDMYDELFLS